MDGGERTEVNAGSRRLRVTCAPFAALLLAAPRPASAFAPLPLASSDIRRRCHGAAPATEETLSATVEQLTSNEVQEDRISAPAPRREARAWFDLVKKQVGPRPEALVELSR